MAAALLVSSAFLHALWNALAKKNQNVEINLMGILLFASLFGLLAIPFFPGPAFANSTSMAWSIAAGLFEAGYMVTLVYALKESSLGLSYTIMRGGAMVIVWIVSTQFLNEAVHFYSALGILCVFIGLYISNVSFGKKMNWLQAKWSYPCAVFIAGYHLCYGRSLEIGAKPAALFALSLVIGVPIFFAFCGKEKIFALKNEFLRKPFLILYGGAFSAASFIIFLIGLRISGAGYAITLRNTSIIFAQVFSLLLGEKLSREQIFGAVIVVIGATLVSL